MLLISTAADFRSLGPISQLSVYRNLALAPVNGTAPNGLPFEEVIFVNDVFVCPRDALELIHQRRVQNAHATCAVDWRATRPTFRRLGFNSVKMYDNWVRSSFVCSVWVWWAGRCAATPAAGG